MNIKWDAQEYTDDFKFVHQYGEDLFDLIEIKKDIKIEGANKIAKKGNNNHN